MSKLSERLNAANLIANKRGISFFENAGSLIAQRPGDASSTTHDTVQKDLGPVTGTFASWCLDAATDTVETASRPNDEQKLQILTLTGFAYPEPVIAPAAPVAADKKA